MTEEQILEVADEFLEEWEADEDGRTWKEYTSYYNGVRLMSERVKFTYITRTICPKSGIHYLDAVDENGYHWSAQQQTGVEKWITYKEFWRRDPQQPLDT